MIRTYLLPTIALSMVCVAAQAQACRDDILSTAPDSRFRDNGNGTVADLATGLIWKQCAEGLSGADCRTGSPSVFTWQQALRYAEAHVFADSELWRLPNKKELASLLEQRCRLPASNSRFFPNTPFWRRLWSSSPYAYDSSSAWYVSFYTGEVEFQNKSEFFFVRLVYGGR